MDIKQMQKIVDNAPELSSYYCARAEMYYSCDKLSHHDCCISLQDLRTELAKHDTLDLEPADIPHGCIVLEK